MKKFSKLFCLLVLICTLFCFVGCDGKTVKEITVTGMETHFEWGESFSLGKDAIVTVLYEDDTTQTLTTSAFDIDFSNFNNRVAGAYDIVVSLKSNSSLKFTYTVWVAEREVESISINENDQPKKVYYAGVLDILDKTKGSIIVKYKNSNQVEIVPLSNNLVKITGYSNDVATENLELTVSFGGATTKYSVEVRDIVPQTLSLKVAPTKLSYFTSDDHIDLTGGEIEVVYNNGTVVVLELTNYQLDVEISNEATLLVSAGENKTVNLSYTYEEHNQTASFEIDVIQVIPVSVTVTANPTKTTYYLNSDENLVVNPAGCILRVEYNDGNVRESVELTASNSNLNYSNAVLGGVSERTETITINYTESETLVQTTFDISLIKKAVSGITIEAPTKTVYYVGDLAEDLSGLRVYFVYNDSSVGTVDLYQDAVERAKIEITGWNFEVPNELLTITVKYTDTAEIVHTDTFNIEVRSIEISNIAFAEVSAHKTKYLIDTDSALDFNGGLVTITYNNLATETLNLLTDGNLTTGFAINLGEEYEDEEALLTLSATENETGLAQRTITLSYTKDGVTCDLDFTFQLVERRVASFVINIGGGKTVYFMNKSGDDALNLTNVTITVTYNDGETNTFDLQPEWCTGFNNASAGEKTITVTYGGVTQTFAVNVYAIAGDDGENKIGYNSLSEALEAESIISVIVYGNCASGEITNIAKPLTIVGGATLTLTNNSVIDSLTINENGTLNLNTKTLTVSTLVKNGSIVGCDDEFENHNYIEVSRLNPTVKTTGSVSYECSYCANEKIVTLPKLNGFILNANGGIVTDAVEEIATSGNETITLPNATKESFEFGGWWTLNGIESGNWGLQILSDTYAEIALEGQIDIYAKWTAEPLELGGANPMHYTASSNFSTLLDLDLIKMDSGMYFYDANNNDVKDIEEVSNIQLFEVLKGIGYYIEIECTYDVDYWGEEAFDNSVLTFGEGYETTGQTEYDIYELKTIETIGVSISVWKYSDIENKIYIAKDILSPGDSFQFISYNENEDDDIAIVLTINEEEFHTIVVANIE